MKVLFYHQNVFLFSIDLDPLDTVLEMKQKIEKTKGIPVSKQTIFFKGKLLFADRDSLTLMQCNIFNKSRLELYFPRSQLKRRNISRALQQTEQSPAPPSTSVKDVIIIEDSPEKNQDSSDNDQVLHQPEKSLVRTYTLDEIFGIQAATEGNVSVQEPSWRNDNRQDWLQRESSSYTVDELFDIQAATEGNVSVEEPSWRYDNRQDWLQRESFSSSPSNIFGDFLFDEDLFFSTELFDNIQEDNNQMLQPTEQSLAPSTSVQTSLEEYQDWSAVESSIFCQMLDQPEQSLARSVTARHDNNQDLLQSEPSSTSHTFGEDLPLQTELFSNIQSHWPASTTQEQRINDQDCPVSEVVHPQKSQPQIRNVINNPDSSESSSNKRTKHLLTVMVLSFPINDKPAMKFPVEVYPTDNVEVLRTELAKMQQRSQLLLPEGGYFFIHETQLLNEKQSFRWNRVAEGDTIEIFPGSVTVDQRTNTRG